MVVPLDYRPVFGEHIRFEAEEQGGGRVEGGKVDRWRRKYTEVCNGCLFDIAAPPLPIQNMTDKRKKGRGSAGMGRGLLIRNKESE